MGINTRIHQGCAYHAHSSGQNGGYNVKQNDSAAHLAKLAGAAQFNHAGNNGEEYQGNNQHFEQLNVCVANRGQYSYTFPKEESNSTANDQKHKNLNMKGGVFPSFHRFLLTLHLFGFH